MRESGREIERGGGGKRTSVRERERDISRYRREGQRYILVGREKERERER